MPPKLATIKLTGPAFEKAREWRDLRDELQDRAEAINNDTRARLLALQEEMGAEMDAAWSAIGDAAGISDMRQWLLVDVFVDEHGEAFLIENPNTNAAGVRRYRIGAADDDAGD